jgi:hypothetical protein
MAAAARRIGANPRVRRQTRREEWWTRRGRKDDGTGGGGFGSGRVYARGPRIDIFVPASQ